MRLAKNSRRYRRSFSGEKGEQREREREGKKTVPRLDREAREIVNRTAQWERDQWHRDRKEIRGAVMVSGYYGFRSVYIFHGPLGGHKTGRGALFPFSSSSSCSIIDSQCFEQFAIFRSRYCNRPRGAKFDLLASLSLSLLFARTGTQSGTNGRVSSRGERAKYVAYVPVPPEGIG